MRVRVVSLLATFAMVWAASVGATGASSEAPEQGPPISEIPICVVPMGPTVWPIGSCSDRPGAQSGGEGESASE